MKEDWNEVIEKLYYEMFEALFAYARNAMGDYSLAEEAVQETFRIACFKKGDLLKSENRPGWLMEVLKYVINNALRRHARLNNRMKTLMSTYRAEFGMIGEDVDIDTKYGDLIGIEDFRLLKRVSLDKNKNFFDLDVPKWPFAYIY